MPKQLRPLSIKDKEKISLLSSFYSTIAGIFYQNKKDQRQEEKRYYPCIPFNSPTEALYLIRKNFPKNKTFLDVGAGYGHVVALARTIGFQAYGIEYAHKEALLDKAIHSVVIDYSCDAFDKFNDYYRKFSVIYFYQPIQDTRLCDKLYEHVIANSEKGTVFIVIGSTNVFHKLTKKLSIVGGSFSCFFIKE